MRRCSTSSDSADVRKIAFVILVLLAGCAEAPREEPVPENSAAIAIVPVTEPPVSRIESTRPGRHDGAVVGGTAGGVVDAVNADPQRIEKARAALADAVAQVGTTEAVAKRTQQSAGPDAQLLPAGEPDFEALRKRGIPAALQVAVTEFEVVPRERDMAIELKVRSRLYRTRDGMLLEQFEKTVHSDFRAYAAWAADEARPLREAIDAACAELGQSVSAVHLRSRPRAGS